LQGFSALRSLTKIITEIFPMKIDDYTKFVGAERCRFLIEQDNMFAFSFGKLTRYWRFLEIIYERYQMASRAYMENTKALYEPMKPGASSLLTEEQQRLHEAGYSLQTELHLEAKIMLDVIARAIEYYFGPAQRASLDSHDALAKNFHTYAAAKSLGKDEHFYKRVTELKTLVANFRDYQIAHEKSPRTIKATVYDKDGDARLADGRLYPKESEVQVESSDLTKLRTELEGYVESVTTFIEANRDKTNLKLAEPQGDAT
jgi:hypothetical protein